MAKREGEVDVVSAVSASPEKKAKLDENSAPVNEADPKSNQLELLKHITSVVADTGDIAQIKKYQPEDATTNPTLILQAVQMPEYASMIPKAIEYAKAKGLEGEELIAEACDKLAVLSGSEILQFVPGYVSTEVSADLSFDTEATIAKAKKLIAMYEEAGCPRGRVLIKIASTWEGIQACKALEAEGIHCNLTLMFSFAQALAAADAGAFLISPFVGRILDWYVKTNGKTYKAEEDPGVLSVRRIYDYYRRFGYKTIVMAASFRSVDEVLALAGCDKMTVAPKFLAELQGRNDAIERRLEADRSAKDESIVRQAALDEKTFRWQFNQDQMATEKLSDGIRLFAADLEKMKSLVRSKLV